MKRQLILLHVAVSMVMMAVGIGAITQGSSGGLLSPQQYQLPILLEPQHPSPRPQRIRRSASRDPLLGSLLSRDGWSAMDSETAPHWREWRRRTFSGRSAGAAFIRPPAGLSIQQRRHITRRSKRPHPLLASSTPLPGDDNRGVPSPRHSPAPLSPPMHHGRRRRVASCLEQIDDSSLATPSLQVDCLLQVVKRAMTDVRRAARAGQRVRFEALAASKAFSDARFVRLVDMVTESVKQATQVFPLQEPIVWREVSRLAWMLAFNRPLLNHRPAQRLLEAVLHHVARRLELEEHTDHAGPNQQDDTDVDVRQTYSALAEDGTPSARLLQCVARLRWKAFAEQEFQPPAPSSRGESGLWTDEPLADVDEGVLCEVEDGLWRVMSDGVFGLSPHALSSVAQAAVAGGSEGGGEERIKKVVTSAQRRLIDFSDDPLNCLSIILASARKLDLADWVLRGLRYKFPSMDATETLITLLALCKAGYRPGSTVMTKDTFIAPVQKTLDAVDYLKPFQLNNLLRVCLDSGIADTKVLRAVLSAILRRLRDYGFDMLNQVLTTLHVHREVVRQTGVLARQQRMPLHAREDGQPDLSQFWDVLHEQLQRCTQLGGVPAIELSSTVEQLADLGELSTGVVHSAMDALQRQAAAEGRYSMVTQETLLRLIKSTNTQPLKDDQVIARLHALVADAAPQLRFYHLTQILSAIGRSNHTLTRTLAETATRRMDRPHPQSDGVTPFLAMRAVHGLAMAEVPVDEPWVEAAVESACRVLGGYMEDRGTYVSALTYTGVLHSLGKMGRLDAHTQLLASMFRRMLDEGFGTWPPQAVCQLLQLFYRHAIECPQILDALEAPLRRAITKAPLSHLGRTLAAYVLLGRHQGDDRLLDLALRYVAKNDFAVLDKMDIPTLRRLLWVTSKSGYARGVRWTDAEPSLATAHQQRDTDPGADPDDSDEQLVAPLFHRAATVLRRRQRELGGNDVTNIAWSFATAGVFDEPLFVVLVEVTKSLVRNGEMSDYDFAGMLLSLGRLQVHERAIWNLAINVFHPRLLDLSPHVLAMLIWSLQKVKHFPSRFREPALQVVVMRLHEFTIAHLSAICSAFAALDPKELNDRHRTVGARLARLVSQHADALAAWQLTNALLVTVRIGLVDTRLPMTVVHEFLRRPTDFGSHQLSNLLWSLARIPTTTISNGDLSDFFDAAARRAVSLLPECNSQDLMGLLWGFSRRGVKRHMLFKAASPYVRAKLSTFTPKEVAYVMWAYTKQGKGAAAPQLLTDMAQEALILMPHFSATDFTGLVWAFAKQEYYAQHFWYAAIQDNFLPNLNSFEPNALSYCLWAFQRSGVLGLSGMNLERSLVNLRPDVTRATTQDDRPPTGLPSPSSAANLPLSVSPPEPPVVSSEGIRLVDVDYILSPEEELGIGGSPNVWVSDWLARCWCGGSS
ncbi:unnamed protein product [Vitrella brassicaformis CCMP3155]|uniref:RAP domain-containing protein n=3 Tax=Vitrella brassicaformis TaxID=1169539 RepID=A0A0G4G4K5_VITBC|nr:unnamed protein product [Vitrella brassicaformis CCMP3155]|eukprot:CEM23196.1 unnamed protein product [Vitrella brassicaformis CCMP3155]